MEINYKKYISPLVAVAVIVYLISSWLSKPEVFGDYTACIGYAGTVVGIVIVVYSNWLWKWKVFRSIKYEDLPVLASKYEGKIKYRYNGGGEKPISFTVKQTLFSIRIKMNTDTNRSNTITSALVKERDEYVLYYTYITDPQSAVIQENPIQYGSAKFIVEEVNRLQGKYWTTSETTGDIFIHSKTNLE